MKNTLTTLSAFAAGLAFAQVAPHVTARLTPAPAVAEVAPVVMEVAPEPIAIESAPESEFVPQVRYQVVEVPPTHGHLKAEILQCQSDACALAVVAKTGMPEIEGTVAIWGTTRMEYQAQLEPGGPWVSNPDMDGDGYWTDHDITLIGRLMGH